MRKIIGPFTQLLTMDKLPLQGHLSDDQLEIIPDGGILCKNGKIVEVGNFEQLRRENAKAEVEYVEGNYVGMPGLIDAHTHICWAGSRANDYAMRLAGKTYLEIAETGGGIWDTVQKTREASVEDLANLTAQRAEKMFRQGTTTIEVKSGYGLSVEHELKILEAIKRANKKTSAELIPTCLAAHILPNDFLGSQSEYLQSIVQYLLPEIKKRNLANRVDIFVEKGAFSVSEAKYYLSQAKNTGFDRIIHGDQFSKNSASLAVELQALSIDHLEYADETEIEILAKSNVFPIVLPGASIGLGERFAPARKLLDAGCSLVIASDWNPGSAPMGDLLVQAAILDAYEKLTMAETLAAITCRAALALKINDIGILKKGNKADFIAFPTTNFKEILYQQGQLKPEIIVSAKSLETNVLG
ncbi:MAG: imidazolonepropionase [Bacteroidetes bacterium]|nr:imidazolonepropionase [Bacteroidota bacterium]